MATASGGVTTGKSKDEAVIAEFTLFSGYHRFIQTAVTTVTTYEGVSQSVAENVVKGAKSSLEPFVKEFNAGTLTAFTLRIADAVGTRRRASCSRMGGSRLWTATLEETVYTVKEG